MVTAQRRANVRHLLLMAKWKQYELWAQSAQNKWEIVGLFPQPLLELIRPDVEAIVRLYDPGAIDRAEDQVAMVKEMRP